MVKIDYIEVVLDDGRRFRGERVTDNSCKKCSFSGFVNGGELHNLCNDVPCQGFIFREVLDA